MDRLLTHDIIGWDIDSTLVESVQSPLFNKFINDNRGKQHHIVTFRTGSLLENLKDDLAYFGFNDMSIFESVLSVPPDVWLQWALLQQRRRSGSVRGKLLLPETTYMEWKGYICKLHGITVLVDDDHKNTQMGCKRYGVDLIVTDSVKE